MTGKPGRPPKKNPIPGQEEEDSAQIPEVEKERTHYVSLDSSRLTITLYGGQFDHRLQDVIKEPIEIEFEPIRDDAELMGIGYYTTDDSELITGLEGTDDFVNGRIIKVKDLEDGIALAIKEVQRRILAEAKAKSLMESEEYVA